jgi:hypothetical protein
MVVLGEEKWIVVVVGNLKEIRYEKSGWHRRNQIYIERKSHRSSLSTLILWGFTNHITELTT